MNDRAKTAEAEEPQSLPVPERCPNCNAATGRAMPGGKCSYCAPPAQSSLQSSPQSDLVDELRETAPRACAYLIDIFVDRLAAQEREIERLRGTPVPLSEWQQMGRELATARARADDLRDALREHELIARTEYADVVCNRCGESWSGKTERHAPDCLAAPTPKDGEA